jgi:oligosaccharide repeat unit polymerase
MIALAGFLLILLSAWAYSVVGRFLHPAPLFPLIWAVVLILDAVLAGTWVDPLRTEAIPVFALGAMCFVAGSLVLNRRGIRAPKKMQPFAPPHRAEIDFRSLGLFCLVLHAIFLPLWWREVARIAGDTSSILLVAYKVRAATTSYEDSIGSAVANYLVAGIIVMPILLIGRARREISLTLVIAAVVPWLIANLVANGRGSLLQFVIASGYAVHVQAKN